MKKTTGTLLVVGIFITFSLATAYSDDFSLWKGKWFKVTNKGSGYYTDSAGNLITQKDTVTNYLQVWDVKANENVLLVHWYDDTGLYYGEHKFFILGNNALDFLCRLEITKTVDSSSYYIGMAYRIQGKLKGEALASATLRTVGGFSWGAIEVEGEGYIEYSAANLTWSGTLIPKVRVPFEPVCKGTEEGLGATYSNGREVFEGPINHGWGTGCPADPPYEHNLYQDICIPVSASPVDWADGGWNGSGDPTQFNVSWNGYIFAPVDGGYSFAGWVDGTVYIEINGEVITDMDTKGSSYGKTVTLPGGRCIPISMSFKTNGGSNNMVLKWRPPGATASEVVPKAYLRHLVGSSVLSSVNH